jgi:hypothetical protein
LKKRSAIKTQQRDNGADEEKKENIKFAVPFLVDRLGSIPVTHLRQTIKKSGTITLTVPQVAGTPLGLVQRVP